MQVFRLGLVQPRRQLTKVVMGYTNKDKTLTAFDPKDVKLQPVNPFGLPAKVNNTADFVLTTIDNVVNWVRTSSMWPMTFGLACCAVEMVRLFLSGF